MCQYSGCNNRCNGHCGSRGSGCYMDRYDDSYYDLYSGSTTGSYYITGGDYVGDVCEKCHRGFLGYGSYGSGYRCRRCRHLYCHSCCFEWKILIFKDNSKKEYGFFETIEALKKKTSKWYKLC